MNSVKIEINKIAFLISSFKLFSMLVLIERAICPLRWLLSLLSELVTYFQENHDFLELDQEVKARMKCFTEQITIVCVIGY